MLKNDSWIKKMALQQKMIEPFEEGRIREGVISFGLSSYGYDFRLSDEFKVPDKDRLSLIDPKNLALEDFNDCKGSFCIIAPNSFVLARSLEYFRIPRKVMGICVGKSTYARCGIITNITPLEPEWEGHITIAVANLNPFPAKIYAKEGIAQVIFFESDTAPELSYADKKGKYQKQKGITPPKV